ncbi:hypothetical protein RIF29_30560 [Crotalaria pallida]|uniref:Uncharacterized protein n=1 Tax=Crotalaria pallida TaxID=3830 RepID=A0AAN9HX26_CROPI
MCQLSTLTLLPLPQSSQPLHQVPTGMSICPIELGKNHVNYPLLILNILLLQLIRSSFGPCMCLVSFSVETSSSFLFCNQSCGSLEKGGNHISDFFCSPLDILLLLCSSVVPSSSIYISKTTFGNQVLAAEVICRNLEFFEMELLERRKPNPSISKKMQLRLEANAKQLCGSLVYWRIVNFEKHFRKLIQLDESNCIETNKI